MFVSLVVLLCSLFFLNPNKPCQTFTCSGLLSDKPDDTLFFLDVGKPKKVEQKGKYVLKLLNNLKFNSNIKCHGLVGIVQIIMFCL